MTELNMELITRDLLNKLNPNNKIMIQHIKDDGSYTIEYVKSINDLSKKYNIPYSTLINIYYTCINKGGGKSKVEKKKYIQMKYIKLLEKIRIFDYLNEDLMNNKEFFNNILKQS